MNSRVLKQEVKGEEESVEDFTERVRKLMSISLGVPLTELTHADKTAYINKLKQEQVRARVVVSRQPSEYTSQIVV